MLQAPAYKNVNDKLIKLDTYLKVALSSTYLIKFAGTSHQEKTKLHSHRDNGTNSQIVCIHIKHEHFDEYFLLQLKFSETYKL